MMYYLAVAQSVQLPAVPTSIFVTAIIAGIIGFLLGKRFR